MQESLQNVENHFEWEDLNILNYLSGELPPIRDYYDEHNIIQKELNELRKLYSSYNCYSTDRKQFIASLNTIIAEINAKVNNWFGLSIETVEYYINLQQGCLLSGAGGIGKSYFIYKLEEELSYRNIKHLCIYGKYQKQLSDIDIGEIFSISKNEQFVFIVDAVNELPEEERKLLFEIIKNLKVNTKVRIIVTYRSFSLGEIYIEKLRQFINMEYRFSGISYESALEVLSKYPIKDLNAYTDILFTNNALLISKLVKVLTSKAKRTDLDSITSVTYILEHDFKECLKQKSIQSQKDENTYWREIKRVVLWMFENDRKDIPEHELVTILEETDIQDYYHALDSMGYIFCLKNRKEQIFYFSDDSLIDYLLSRSLFNKIRLFDVPGIIKLLQEKVKVFPSAIDSFILVIFDKFKDNYEIVYKVLKESNLLNELSFGLLVKVITRKENIENFQRVFYPKNPVGTILYFSGYVDKPFNCTNYLHKYLIEHSNAQLSELSALLSNNLECQDFLRRLKNMLYYLIFAKPKDDVILEYFYTGLWASAAPNEKIRILARKILFEAVRINNDLIGILINIFPNILDLYIKNAIIETLFFHKSNQQIKKFFLELKNNYDFLSADCIALIANYLDEKYQYINWEKKNLFHKTTRKISDEFGKLLFSIDLYDKTLLHFRYWDKNRIDNVFPCFLNVDKAEINDFNKFLDLNFQCVRSGECNGLLSFEEYIKKKYKKKYNSLPVISFLKSFEETVYYIFSIYNFSRNVTQKQKYSYTYEDLLERKLVIIAQDIFYGSLMCNYYEDDFVLFNDETETIGYKSYNPLAYDVTENYAAPIPTYNNEIEKMQNLALKNIDVRMQKDEKWVKDAIQTKSNVISVINTPIICSRKEWMLLAAKITLKESVEETTSWQDNYNVVCCIDEDIGLQNDEDDRYLTIEHQSYNGLLENYKFITDDDCLCKEVNQISSHTDVLDNTYLLLPPAKLIRDLKLIPDYKTLSWVNNDGEEIIRCNNNKTSYYKDYIKCGIFLRKDIFDEYSKKNTIKYFVYTERLIGGYGFADDTNFHLELKNGKIIKQYYNHRTRHSNPVQEIKCKDCPYGLNKKHERMQVKPFTLNYELPELTVEDFTKADNVEIFWGKNKDI